jgi:ElaB/YqjD/DUF883 family membrane-anchored ribosome-binding protein
MADKDDIAGKLRRAGDNAKDALEHASGAAIEAARGAVSPTPEVKARLTEAAGRAREMAARRIHETDESLHDATSMASRVYDRASDTAQHGYDLASARVASAPLSSVLVAGLVGVLIGWAWRGSSEADRRADLVSRLPRHLRDRLGL